MPSAVNKQKNATKKSRRLGEAGDAGVVSTGIAEFVSENLAGSKIQQQQSRPTTKFPATQGVGPRRSADSHVRAVVPKTCGARGQGCPRSFHALLPLSKTTDLLESALGNGPAK